MFLHPGQTAAESSGAEVPGIHGDMMPAAVGPANPVHDRLQAGPVPAGRAGHAAVAATAAGPRDSPLHGLLCASMVKADIQSN